MRGALWPAELRHGPITLRPLRRRDEAEWLRVRRENHDWLQPWEATVPPGAAPGPATFGALVRALNTQAKQGRSLPFAVCVDDAGRSRFAGQVTVSGIVHGSAQTGQIGYWIDRAYAGRGIIPLAVAMACDHCWAAGLHRIEIAIRPENAPSLRVVAKLGFRFEGTRPAYLHIDHDWRDHHVFALNREEVPGGLVARLTQRVGH